MRFLKSLSLVFVLFLLTACIEINIDNDGNQEDQIMEPDTEMEDIAIETDDSEEADIDSHEETEEDILNEIKVAFQRKYPDWDMETKEIFLNDVRENHIAGGITEANAMGGGGYFFAARTDDGWVIAADGNGAIFCDDIEPYDFPDSMISECVSE